jgi:hypothetical protein
MTDHAFGAAESCDPLMTDHALDLPDEAAEA